MGAGAAIMVLGALMIVPTALGVSQYTTARIKPRTGSTAYNIYIVQAVFLSIASVVFVLGMIMLIMSSTKQGLTLQ